MGMYYWINFLSDSKHNFPEHGSDALKLPQAMQLKLWRAVSICTLLRLRSRPYYMHIWAVHAPTDWYHVLLCALKDKKQNRNRDKWNPLLKRTAVETLHRGSDDEIARCLAHDFFIEETSFFTCVHRTVAWSDYYLRPVSQSVCISLWNKFYRKDLHENEYWRVLQNFFEIVQI
jgi:hypothetical protein